MFSSLEKQERELSHSQTHKVMTYNLNIIKQKYNLKLMLEYSKMWTCIKFDRCNKYNLYLGTNIIAFEPLPEITIHEWEVWIDNMKSVKPR